MIVQSMVKQKGAGKRSRYVQNFKQALPFQCHIVFRMSFDTMLKLNVKNVKGTEILNMALEYSLRDLYITFFKTC